jgi:hypothetical protein
VKKRSGGFTFLEIVITLAIFGTFLLILVILTAEMRSYEKRMPVNFMAHPQVAAVLTRLRRDILDADASNPYPGTFESYSQSTKTLIVRTFVRGGVQTVVWDFSTAGEAKRVSWNVGIATEWIGRGLPPEFIASFDAVETPDRPFGVRLQAFDGKGLVAVDEYFQPRAHGK